jgi:hypothetical protein
MKSYKCKDVTFKDDFPVVIGINNEVSTEGQMTEKQILKADDAFWKAYNFITGLDFNNVEEAKVIRETMENAKNAWQMNFVLAVKAAIKQNK